MKRIISVLAVLLFSLHIVYSQQLSIDDSNRVAVVELVKDATVTFTFYGDSYTLELGGFDFDHNRVTVEMHPQLGTDIINLNVGTNWDLDIDGEDDMALTLVLLDPNKGSNAKGEVGTAQIRIESLKPISLELTTVTTRETTSVAPTETTDEEEESGGSIGGMSTSTIAIIAGIVVGVGVILFLLKDKIKGMFKGGGGAAGGQQTTPTNYKPAKASGGGMKCSKCGKDIAPGAKFCNNCGAKTVDKKKFCPECGTEYKGGKFCQNCGHKMV